MLTLNDTAVDDNLAVFVMELYAEGNNLIANSRFDSSSSTGWTLNGDWLCQNNRLECTYSASAGATAQYEIAATTSESTYVLEYEVIAVNGTITFELEGAFASNIIGANLTIPQTVGKHSVRIVADGGTTVGLGTGAMGAGDYIYVDNIKIRLEEDVIRISTRDIVLASPSTTFDGQVMSFNSLSDVDGYIDVEASGGIGAVTGYSFKLKRYASNTRTSDFFNEFFPAYNGGQIVARKILFGIVWDSGSPDYADITWLMRGKVIDYSYEPRSINIIVLQSTEIEPIKEAPYYTIQKDFNNFVSYFTNAPDENYGEVLPIVYGDFNVYADDQALFRPRLFPVICVEKHKLTYVAGYHKFQTENMSSGGASVMYQYLDDLDTYMTLLCVNGSSTNDFFSLSCTHYDTLNSSDNIILGTINIHPILAGSRNDHTDYANIIDEDNSTTATSTYDGGYDEISVKIKGGGSSPGVLSRAANSILLLAYITDATLPGTLQTGMNYYNPEYDSGTGGDGSGDTLTWASGVELETYDLSADFTGRDVSDEPWRWDELMGLEYWIRAQSGYAITIRDLWLRVTNIVVNDPRLVRPRTSGRGSRERLRNRGGR